MSVPPESVPPEQPVAPPIDPPAPLPTDLPVQSFADQAALEAWLEVEHRTAPGLYVKIAKKGSGIPSIDWAQMVEVLLCFGWIDGRANRLDDRFYLQRTTPRRPRSVWSKKNVATVERLIAEGRMRPAGLAVVEAAKADGRWERAYAGPATGIHQARGPSASARPVARPGPPPAAPARSARPGAATRA